MIRVWIVWRLPCGEPLRLGSRPRPARMRFMETVLVVEDERDIRDVLRRYLERAGFAVLTTGSGAEAIELLSKSTPAVAILDLGLPDIDGLEVLRAAHAMQTTSVIVLSARSSVEDRIRGLELGAADYVPKPFSPTEVVLRVQSVIGRSTIGANDSNTTTFGSGRLIIDEAKHLATFDGKPLELTPSEWGVLLAITAAPGRVYSRYELVNQVRGYEFAGYERTIDTHIKNLRRKLNDTNSELIRTVIGVGYKFGLPRD